MWSANTEKFLTAVLCCRKILKLEIHLHLLASLNAIVQGKWLWCITKSKMCLILT